MGDGNGSRIAADEAYALALAGRRDEALRLLDEVVSRESPGDQDAWPARLARARILLSGADGGQTGQAIETLSRLAATEEPLAWCGLVELARAAIHRGDKVEAASLVGRAIEQFRRAAPHMGALADTLSGLVSREAERLEYGEASSSGVVEATVDSASLLRLVELGRSMARETDPDAVLRLVLREAIALVAAERGFVVLVRGDDLEFSCAENLDRSEVEDPSFEVSRALIRTATFERRSVFLSVPDLSGGHPAKESLCRAGVCSVACVPIVDEGHALGALYLDRRRAIQGFDARNETVLELFAAQAAAALRSATALREKTRALEAAEETIRRQRTESIPRASYGTLVGVSHPMQAVYRRLDLIGPSEAPVLLLGETGTGKELVARLIHERGPRAGRELVAVNCAGLSDTLLESELFGHERGAFTGADRARAGLFEVAHRGTLFLDEVGDMSPRMQADLLRVLQSGEVRRVGGRETIHVDVRVIAATHRDLETMVKREEFRQDLYYRLNVLNLRLPSLRERPEDVPLLVTILLERLPDGPGTEISERAMGRLAAYGWPGNVREMENILRRLILLGVSPIEEDHLPEEVLGAVGPQGPRGSLRDLEAESILKALEAAGNNKAKAARMLGIDRTTLYDKLRRLGKH